MNEEKVVKMVPKERSLRLQSDRANGQNMENTIDLLNLMKRLLKYVWIIVAVTILSGGICGAYSVFAIKPVYQAGVMLYVNNSSISVGSTSVSVADLTASQNLVDTYIVILRSRNVMNKVIEKCDLPYDAETLNKRISAQSLNGTEVFSIYVKSTSPQEAELVANTLAETMTEVISDVVEGTSVKIVDYAEVPTKKIYPSNVNNAMKGAAVGFVLITALFVLIILLDNTIQSESDLTERCEFPVLASIPDHQAKETNHYYSSYNKEKRKDKKRRYGDTFVGDDLSFEGVEAYNLLRTNVIYSMVEDHKSKRAHVIGVTSSIQAEYKTTTSINLALSLAKDHKKTLLLDCDLRLSAVLSRMNIPGDDIGGLSDYLVGKTGLSEVIRKSSLSPYLHIIAGGNASPNPADLLGSEKMKKSMESLAQVYDYIIVDMPPVMVVSDALILGKVCDGLIMVARERYTEKDKFEQGLKKIRFVGIPVLGIALTGVGSNGFFGSSYEKHSYKKYYGGYYNSDHKKKGKKNRGKRVDE